METYGLYARQSRDKKDSVSVDSQFEFCMKEVPAGAKVIKYKDKGFSGKNIDRPDFQKLLKDIEKGKIKKVVVYRLDRMSRSTLDFSELMQKFKKYNVDFISSTEKFDTSTPIGQAMLSIIMVFAELERKTIQQRITDNYYERGKKGMYLGGQPPFGFDLVPTIVDGFKTKMLVPNKNIDVVKRIFDYYANTALTLGEISRILNDEGIRTLNNKYFDSNRISKTLKNYIYVTADVDMYSYFKSLGCIMHNEIDDYIGTNGVYVYGKGIKYKDIEGYNVVIAPHEGIIDSYTWLKCQNKLSKNKKIKNAGKSTHSWLSGLILCKKCGYAMSVNKAPLSIKHNTQASYFRCSGRSIKRVCDADSVRANVIEQNVEMRIFDFIEHLDSTVKINKAKEYKKVNEIKIAIANKETEIENLIDGLSQAKGAAMKYINKRLDQLDNELSLLREDLKKENQSDDLDSEKIIKLKAIVSVWNEMDIEDKKEIARMLIKKIHVENEIVKIDWIY